MKTKPSGAAQTCAASTGAARCAGWRERRRRLLFLLAGLGGAAALAGCQRRADRHAPLPADATVLALGDSLTYGTGAPAGQSYPDELARLTGWQLVNAGVPGHTSAQALERAQPLLAQHQPALLLLSVGGNDFLRGVPADVTRENLRAIALAAREAGVPTVLLAVPRPTLAAAVTRRLDDHPLYAALAAELDLPLHAQGWSAVLSDDALRADRIHANAEGYLRFAQGLLRTLKAQGFIAQ